MFIMKNGNNNVKIVAVSLPKGVLKKADERAYALFQSRSEYLKNLILSDLKLATVAIHDDFSDTKGEELEPKKGA